MMDLIIALLYTGINSCENSICTHICLLSGTDPGYVCACPEGHLLKYGFTCKGVVSIFLLSIQILFTLTGTGYSIHDAMQIFFMHSPSLYPALTDYSTSQPVPGKQICSTV